jgi:hypothetical protein
VTCAENPGSGSSPLTPRPGRETWDRLSAAIKGRPVMAYDRQVMAYDVLLRIADGLVSRAGT